MAKCRAFSNLFCAVGGVFESLAALDFSLMEDSDVAAAQILSPLPICHSATHGCDCLMLSDVNDAVDLDLDGGRRRSSK